MQSILQLTVSSVISIILYSLCFALLLKLILDSDKILSRVKYELLLLFLLAPIIKIIIPIEILPWTKNVVVPYLLPDLLKCANYKLVTIEGNDFTVWNAVMLALVLGMLIVLIKTIVSYISFRHYVDMLPKVDNPLVYQILERLQEEKEKKTLVELKWTNESASASIGGARKPYILLPKTELSEAEWESILRHELAHYYHGDLLIRMGWCFIKIICWWNPAVYVLDRQFEKLLEIRADENAIKSTNEEKNQSYLEALVNLSRENKISEKGSEFCAFFQEDYGIAPQRRVKLMLARDDVSKASVLLSNLITLSTVLVLTVAMNVFIFEPKSKIPEDYERTKVVTSSEYFLVRNADGTFDMYMNGVFCATVKTDMGSDMAIYDSLEEALKNEGY